MKLICCGRQRENANGGGQGNDWSWLPKWVPERFRPQSRSESMNPMASNNSSGGTSGSRSATGSGVDRGGYPRGLGALENSAREKKRPGRSEMTETNSVMTFDDDYLAAYRDTSPPKPKSNFVSNYATNYTPTNNHTAENGNTRGDYDLESAYSTPLASAASAPSSTTSSRESLPPSRPSMSAGEQYYAYTPRVDRVGSHSPPPMVQRTSSNFAELSLPPRPQSLPPPQSILTRVSANFAELSLPPQTYIPRG